MKSFGTWQVMPRNATVPPHEGLKWEEEVDGEFIDANGVRRSGCEPARMPLLKDGMPPLEAFAHEVAMGAYRPEELRAAAELALKRHAQRLCASGCRDSSSDVAEAVGRDA